MALAQRAALAEFLPVLRKAGVASRVVSRPSLAAARGDSRRRILAQAPDVQQE